MKPAPFDYYSPDTLEEAVALLAKLENEDLDAKILAGGQSLMPMLSLRLARPDALVDLRKIGALDYIREDGDTIAIGAMTSKSAAEDSDVIRTRQPLFHEATLLVGHRQIRNRGTVGGSFAHAEPTAEYGAAAMVLGMDMKVVGPNGERIVPAKDFYVTYLTADIDSTEILTEVRLPVLKKGTGWSFQEMSRRQGDHALARRRGVQGRVHRRFRCECQPDPACRGRSIHHRESCYGRQRSRSGPGRGGRPGRTHERRARHGTVPPRPNRHTCRPVPG